MAGRVIGAGLCGDSDTGADTRICGVGLGWDSTWENDKLTGPSRTQVDV